MRCNDLEFILRRKDEPDKGLVWLRCQLFETEQEWAWVEDVVAEGDHKWNKDLVQMFGFSVNNVVWDKHNGA